MILFAKLYFVFFGIISIAGGLMGYVKAHSVISLISGGIAGALLLVAGYFLPAHFNTALIIALVVSVMLAGRFVPKFIETHAPFPHGVMSLLSLAGLVVTLLAWYARR